MILSFKVDNFMGFKRFDYEQPSALTVVIGKNDTGKTSLLKLLYANAKALVKANRTAKDVNLKHIVSEKLYNTFMPLKSGLGELVSKGEDASLELSITFAGTERFNLYYGFSAAAKELGHCSAEMLPMKEGFNALFLPAKEVLMASKAIKDSRQYDKFLDFDDTYTDIIDSLNVPTSKGKVAGALSQTSDRLEDLFEGEIVQNLDDNKNPFLFKKGNATFSMPMTAEGIKKIGIITTLIRNRELSKNTMLFLDEPETALHPEAQRKFAEMLYAISTVEGIQVFLATHSYFMINQFAIIARREKRAINCISIEKEKGKKFVDYRIDNLMDGLPDNSIIAEAQAMFREEMKIELGL
jgi:AAA15 family ATPase/GTPase